MFDVPYLFWLALLTSILAAFLVCWPRQRTGVAGGLALVGIGGLTALQMSGVVGFTFLRLLAWLLFAALPVYLLFAAWRLKSKTWAAAGVLLLLTSLYTFCLEPRMLAVTFHRVQSPKIQRPLRVVLLSDIQTDHVTAFERKALLKTRALQPDLVLFSGDYIQQWDPTRHTRELERFNKILKEVGLTPSLGAFAVGGDVEWDIPWTGLFKGTGVRCLERTSRVNLGDLELVGLTLRDSRVGVTLAPTRQFRIVFGHAPDFALQPLAADLMLAGHTHGGQVQVPFFGPLVTLSRVPRRWAGGGLVTLPGGRHLIVSRGIGMERGSAPRLRFNCRPQIVVVDLAPAAKPQGGPSHD